MKKKLLIIDGNAIVHRAYHALPPLKNKKGELVNAVYGFCLIFLKALKDIEPDFVVSTFDVKGPTFRHKQFKQYKAKRKKAPDELYNQIKGVKKVLTAFDIIFNKINPYFPTADTKLVSNKNLIESYHNSLSPFGKLFLDFRNMLDEKQEVYKTATFSDKLTCNIPDNQNLTQAVSDLLSLNKSVLYFKQILEKKQKVYDKLGEGVFLESAIRLPDDYRAGVKSTIGRFKGLYDNISSVYNKTFDDLFSQNTELDKSILILRNQKKL